MKKENSLGDLAAHLCAPKPVDTEEVTELRDALRDMLLMMIVAFKDDAFQDKLIEYGTKDPMFRDMSLKCYALVKGFGDWLESLSSEDVKKLDEIQSANQESAHA